MKYVRAELLIILSACVAVSSVLSFSRIPATSSIERDLSYLKLMHEVRASMEERHLSDHMLPVCVHHPERSGPPSFKQEPQQWQKVANKKLLVFSAFYERREAADGPAIRIIASGFQTLFNQVGDHYCQLWYEDLKHPVAVGPAIYNVIYPSTMHPDMWVSHFVICQLPVGYDRVPYAVSVTSTRCEPATNQLMVLNRENVTPSDTHAVCISPMYNGYNQWDLLVEQIEIQKILGASEITLYNLHPGLQTLKVAKSYVNDLRENVNLINWPFPGIKSNVWCQRGALNDCLYRMGHRHKYVVIIDMDEILVPRKDNTWLDLINRLQSESPSAGAFLFQHAYFRRNTTNEKPVLITQSSFWRTDEVTPPGKIRCKSMYEASKTVSIDLHFPYLLVPGAKELILDPEDGMLHHYRPSPMETFRKYPERYHYIEDRFMERYKQQLVQTVNNRYKKAQL